KIINAIKQARDVYHADVIVFPELTLTSYPPEDLLFRTSLYDRINNALNRIESQSAGIDIILGYPSLTLEGCFNTAAFIHDGKITATYHKQMLPNYSLFDEKRYFNPG